MFLRNDYDRGLRNGSLDRIVTIEEGKVTVDFDGTEQELAGLGLEDLTLAYAITVHKAQGSSFRKVHHPDPEDPAAGPVPRLHRDHTGDGLAVMAGAGDVLRQALDRDAHAERRETALGILLD